MQSSPVAIYWQRLRWLSMKMLEQSLAGIRGRQATAGMLRECRSMSRRTHWSQKTWASGVLQSAPLGLPIGCVAG